MRTFVLTGGGNYGLFFHIGGQEHWFWALWPFVPHRWAGALVLSTRFLAGGPFFAHRWAGSTGLFAFCPTKVA